MPTLDVVLLTGAATTLATEGLKRVSQTRAADYPRLTAVVVSIIASVVAVTQTPVKAEGIVDWAILVVGTLFVAVLTYNNLIKGKEKK